ncbi:hypothetical protein DYB32_005620 [Aphanomyces invadans]|uniref:Dynein assembly factor 1, axonemal homolog n=1 Tax=Aphanomyces invadans TaxID=157072 RepID=A0A418AU39_9STRA|nr:hypothetical protein DYB32_005620 [Aphanomyces invadans]
MFSTNNEEIDFLERLKRRDREKLKLKQKGHLPVMDRETLVQLCVDNDGYETPELNDNLFAHFKGFQKIEGLEPFYNLKALWLESNGLSVIENLDCLVHLRCLYMNKNRIERIENLHNAIRTIEGLGALTQLTSFNISKNELEHVEDIEALKNYKSITNLDLSHNKLADPSILHVFEAMANLKALRLTDWQREVREKKLTELATTPSSKCVEDSNEVEEETRRVEAQADSDAEKALVHGNGIVELGAAFWAEEDKMQRQKHPQMNEMPSEQNVASHAKVKGIPSAVPPLVAMNELMGIAAHETAVTIQAASVQAVVDTNNSIADDDAEDKDASVCVDDIQIDLSTDLVCAAAKGRSPFDSSAAVERSTPHAPLPLLAEEASVSAAASGTKTDDWPATPPSSTKSTVPHSSFTGTSSLVPPWAPVERDTICHRPMYIHRSTEIEDSLESVALQGSSDEDDDAIQVPVTRADLWQQLRGYTNMSQLD